MKTAASKTLALEKPLLKRAPKQDRSRASFERVIEAAARILEERGHADLTLSEVSRRARVSIGSIYCRVDSKDELVRIVQQREIERMNRESAQNINRIRRRALPLRELVPALVREFAELIRKHGKVLGALIELAATDPVISAAGKRNYQEQALDFRLLLLERRSEIRHPDPEHAATFCFAMVYGMIARYLGFGSRDAAGEGDWRQLVEDLATASLALLLTNPAEVRPAGR